MGHVQVERTLPSSNLIPPPHTLEQCTYKTHRMAENLPTDSAKPRFFPFPVRSVQGNALLRAFRCTLYQCTAVTRSGAENLYATPPNPSLSPFPVRSVQGNAPLMAFSCTLYQCTAVTRSGAENLYATPAEPESKPLSSEERTRQCPSDGLFLYTSLANTTPHLRKKPNAIRYMGFSTGSFVNG